MPNVAEIIKDHVTLEVRCIDRLYLNAYIPRLQSGGGVDRLSRPRLRAEDCLAGDPRPDHDGVQSDAPCLG